MGRPSSVSFPPELFEQGWALLLSGINNTLAIHSNPQWVWPYWVEQQLNPSSPSFIPTGVNIMTVNLSHRNWTSLGLAGSKKEIMVDPVGMLTLKPYSWSVFPYVKSEGKIHVPPRMDGSVEQELLDGVLPGVRTHYRTGSGLQWSSEIYVYADQGEELVALRNQLVNSSSEIKTFSFGLSIRPYNPLTLGPLNKLKYKNRLWRANREPGLLLLSEPDFVHVSNRDRGDPIFYKHGLSGEPERYSLSGIVAGISEYQITLRPNESRELICLGTLGKIDLHPNSKFQYIDARSVRLAYSGTRELWKSQSLEGLEMDIPQDDLSRAFQAVRNRFPVFDDGEYFTPGTFVYHQTWIRDSVYMMSACDKMNWPQRVAGKFELIFKNQLPNGFFRSQTGEWDSNGQVLWALASHCRYFGKGGEYTHLLPKLIKGVRWIMQQTEKSRTTRGLHAGLLPAGFSAEHFGPNDHYFWDNFWSLAGIRDFMELAKDSNWKLPEWIEEYYEGYCSDVWAALDHAYEKEAGLGLPCSPYRRMDSAAIGNLVAVDHLELFGPNEDWVGKTVQFLWETNCRQGLFFQQIIHTGLNVYLSIQLARVMMLRGDQRFRQILHSILKHATPTWTWPEAIHPRTLGGCMGDGDHGWAAAEFLSLVRDMYVKDLRESLHLGWGLDPVWFSSRKSMGLSNAVTRHGTVSYRLNPREDVWELEYNIVWHQAKRVPVYFHLPFSLSKRRPQASLSELPNQNLLTLEADQGCICLGPFNQITSSLNLVGAL